MMDGFSKREDQVAAGLEVAPVVVLTLPVAVLPPPLMALFDRQSRRDPYPAARNESLYSGGS